MLEGASGGATSIAGTVLSPTNKRSGEQRQQYGRKRLRIADTLTSLVALHLLRSGESFTVLRHQRAVPREDLGDYRVLVTRGYDDQRGELFPFRLQDRLPTITIPLRQEDQGPEVDLQRLLQVAYERGAFDAHDAHLDYTIPPVPPLTPDDAAWADALLRAAGWR